MKQTALLRALYAAIPPTQQSNKVKAYLAQESRLERVCRLFESGGELESKYTELEEYYADFITQEHSGLPKRSKQQGYSYFGQAWNELDGLADYLLSCTEEKHGAGVEKSQSEKNMRRKMHRKKRRSNLLSYSTVRLPHQGGEESSNHTTEERIELMAWRNGCTEQFQASVFDMDSFCTGLNTEQRRIVNLLHDGYSRKELQNLLEVSPFRLRMKIKRIGGIVKANM